MAITGMAILVSVAMVVGVGAQQDDAKAKSPVPSMALRTRLEREVRDLFKADYVDRSQKGRQALASKLMAQAKQTGGRAAEQYVFLCEARDVAASSADLETALAAVDEIAGSFDIAGGLKTTRAKMTLDALSRIRKSARTAFHLQALARAYLKTADEAVAAEDYESAVPAAREAERLARRLKDQVLATRARNLSREVPALKREMKSVGEARLTVAENPDDPEANETLGMYFCFVGNDWARGLACLAKASDGGLRLIAGMERRNPTGAIDRHGLGNVWLSYADKQRNALRRLRYRGRAAYWYVQALEDAKGLLRARIEKKLSSLNVEAVGSGDLLKLIDPARHAVKGTWSFEGEVLHSADSDEGRLQIPFVPPAEYDLRVVVSRHEGDDELIIGLVVGGSQTLVELRTEKAGLSLVDGEDPDKNGTEVRIPMFPDTRPRTIVCSVRKNRVRVTVDGKMLIDWQGLASRLSLDKDWSVPEKRALFLGGDNTVYRFHEVTLLPISGKGERLR